MAFVSKIAVSGDAVARNSLVTQNAAERAGFVANGALQSSFLCQNDKPPCNTHIRTNVGEERGTSGNSVSRHLRIFPQSDSHF